MPASPCTRTVHSYPTLSIGILALCAGLVTALAARNNVRADETLLPQDALLTVHIDSLEALQEIPLLTETLTRLHASRQIQEALQSVEARQFIEGVAFLEQRLARPWARILADLTSGGVVLAVQNEGGPQIVLIVHTVDKEFATDIVEFATELAAAGRPGGMSSVKVGEHRGITGYRIGNVALAQLDSRLIVSTRPELLKATVDRLLDQVRSAETVVEHDRFGVSARLDLDELRSFPRFADGVTLPADNPGAIALLGGWVDLLRRHQSLTLDVRLGTDRIDATVRFEGADDPSPDSLDGFWADSPHEHPAPLLMVPGVIYSTSWYRDFGALWDARAELVSAETVKQMEQADAQTAAQFETLGSAVPLSELVRQLGPRVRIVVAEQPEAPYGFELRNQLPAAALAVDLDDEAAFRDLYAPLARVVHLILSFEQKITPDRLEHAGAQLQQLSFPHTEKDVARRDPVQYNFRPTHCVTRGHFILGTTPDIVRQIIDAIDAQSQTDGEPGYSGTTSEQFVDITRIAAELDKLRDGIVRRSVLQSGLDVETAEHDFDQLLSILRLFDKKTVTSVFTESGFEHRLSVATNPPSTP